MSDFCHTCALGSIWDDYCYFEENPDAYKNCESGSYQWYDSQSFAPCVGNPELKRKLFESVYGFDQLPTSSCEFEVMICEGCSRSGSLICVTDSSGFCVDPNCDKHGEINRAKGWYEIGGDIKTLGTYWNKNWGEYKEK
jgi:hypothetical protein